MEVKIQGLKSRLVNVIKYKGSLRNCSRWKDMKETRQLSTTDEFKFSFSIKDIIETNDLLVIYGCVTHYPKFSCLKTTLYCISVGESLIGVFLVSIKVSLIPFWRL